MAELEISGESGNGFGPSYVKFVLDELSCADCPEKLENIASQVRIFENLGTISEPVANAVLSFIERSVSGVLP